jgi:Lysyl oxidase
MPFFMPGRRLRRTPLTVVAVALAILTAPVLWGAGAAPPPPQDPGSLVQTSMQSEVGVVLDELPTSMRARVAAALVAKPSAFWKERASTQLRLAVYRLVFRKYFYSAARDALPLPPEPMWTITLGGAPARRTVDGHDVVSVPYQFSSTLLSDFASPAVSEPQLAKVGGTWDEPFILPIDPELLLQRTGFACMDEDSFPFNSVDSEEADSFYDQTAVVEKVLSNVGHYHFTRQPTESCVEALQNHVGRVVTSLRFRRLAWNSTVASQARFGAVTGNEPDLQIYLPDFLPSRTTYRYVHATGSGSCEVEEGSVGGTGWRRLLQFATSDENVGNRALTIGGVDYTLSGHAGELDLHNLFELSPCHQHYHFKYYGDLGWAGNGTIANSKLGFCLQSTNRVANREGSPLHNQFAGCDFQGVEAGWVDQYKAGLPNQWLDTTDLKKGVGTRSFRSNPNGFLCEGTFVDASGNPLGPNDPVVWAPTGLIAENGEPVEAPLCQKIPTWADNNFDTTQETIEAHGLGLITSACTRGQIGPLRNCGFGTSPKTVDCVPGRPTTATFSIKSGAPPQVVRLTEYSHALAAPIPARYEDSWVPLQPGVSDQPAMLANAIVSSSTTVTFPCPSPRTAGAAEPGGTYSIYTGPVFPDDPASVVSRS